MHQLTDEEGRPLGLVLKNLRAGGVSAASGLLPTVKREWAVGRLLSRVLSGHEFLRTGAGAHSLPATSSSTHVLAC